MPSGLPNGFYCHAPTRGTHAKIIIVARIPTEIKITYKYVGDESPKAKAEAQKKVDEVFDMIFDEVYKDLKQKRVTTSKSSIKK